jgi:hypothetical protein
MQDLDEEESEEDESYTSQYETEIARNLTPEPRQGPSSASELVGTGSSCTIDDISRPMTSHTSDTGCSISITPPRPDIEPEKEKKGQEENVPEDTKDAIKVN